MPATIEESIIKIGDKSYKKRDVVAYLVDVGQFQELQLRYRSKTIYICSSDPNSSNYQNEIFGKTAPSEAFRASLGEIQVVGKLNLTPVTIATNGSGGINTFTYTKINHGFPVPSVVAWTGLDWVLADKDTIIDVFIIVESTADTFTIGLPGCHAISHGLGNDPGPIYLGDPPNGLTRTAPSVGQIPKKQIILGQVLDATHLWIQPEWRAS